MEEIFEEVNEDLKQKQLKEFWEENKNWIIGGVLGSIIATASMSGYRSWEHKRDVNATAKLSHIVEELKTSGTDDLETFIASTNKNHALIARLILAANFVENGDTDKAINTYKIIANTKGVDKNYKNYAKFLSVKYNLDNLSSDEVAVKTKELLNTNWKHLSLELQAVSLAKENKFANAAKILNMLSSDPQTPNALRGRAIKLTELYSSKLNK